MLYIGIDLHLKTTYVTAIDEDQRVVAKANLPSNADVLVKYLMGLNTALMSVMESCSAWYWAYDALTEAGLDVIVSNPKKTRAIASQSIKTDRKDSLMLARLLRAGMIEPVYVAQKPMRHLKEMLRHRMRLVRDATRMKNRIRNILAKMNVVVPWKSLWGPKGRAFLEKLALQEPYGRILWTYHTHLDSLKEQIRALTHEMEQEAENNPQAKLLMTAPGVGPIVAMTFLAEVGEIRRFPTYRHLASYLGLIPRLEASGAKERTGRITKEGPVYLRSLLVEAAHVIGRCTKGHLHSFYWKMLIRKDRKKAAVATAHKLAKLLYFMLRDQRPYTEELPSPA
mgnify:CR=1 FL=1